MTYDASLKPSSFPLIRGIALSCGALLVPALLGCGGEDDKGTGQTNDIDLGNLGSGGGSNPVTNPNGNGGRKEITQDQADALESAACTGWGGEGETLPVVLQLVVDVSRSMTLSAPGTRRSKWDTTRSALEEAIESMPAGVSVGVLYYPNMFTDGGTSPSDVSSCIDTDELVPIAPLGNRDSTHRATLASSFDEVDVDGYTPTYDAYTYALDHSLLPYEAQVNKFMLLITDGAPTFDQGCVNVAERDGIRGGVADAPTQPIIDEIQNAYDEHNIRTFLIGSPGSEESAESNSDMRPWLSQSAILGGTAPEGCQQTGPDFCHLDMTQEPDFAAALSAGLASVAGQIIDACTFKTPEPPTGEEIDPSETNLVINWGDGTASLILSDSSGDCSDGWQFNSAGDVVLCPATCDEVKLDASARVQLTFGCSVEETEDVLR